MELSDMVPYHHLMKRRFYVEVCGEKNPSKKEIINECLKLCARRWKRKDGNIYELTTWNTMLKVLFSHFRQQNILYNFMTDFNGTGDFHSILTDDLKKGSKNIKDYGTLKNQAKFDYDGDNKIRTAIKNKVLNPFDNYEDLVRTVVYICGRYFALRGRKEISLLKWADFSFEKYEHGPDKGKNCVQLIIENHTTYQKYKVGKSAVKNKNELTFKVRENPDDIIDPFKMIKLFRSFCPPEQVRFFCRVQTPKMEHARRTNTVDGILVPILYKTSPNNVMGQNVITEKTRELAKICGWENWEECTNHGLRAMGVTILHNSININLTNKPVPTHCRHASEKSQNPYNRDTLIANSNLQDALIGDVAKKSSATPVDTELSVLKKMMDELKNENKLLRDQVNRKNYCIIM